MPREMMFSCKMRSPITLRRCFSSGSFLSGSLGSSGLSSLCSLFLSLGSSLGSLLFSYLLSLLLVLSLLSLELGSSSVLLSLGLSLGNLVQTILLVSLPSLELLLCSSLVECALLDATFQVFHHIDALAAKDVTNSVGWLCTTLDPIECTLEIKFYCGRIGVWVVSTNLLSETTITWCTSVSDNDAVECVALTSAALQSDFCCHCLKCLNFVVK